ncbi:MAG: hypothetical protein ACYSR0_09870 [Planctomycetota bacterium]|jgi:hypothetical protein
MTNIKKDIEEIKKKLDDICNVLGIGIVPPAKVIELNREADKIVRKLNGNKKKDR